MSKNWIWLIIFGVLFFPDLVKKIIQNLTKISMQSWGDAVGSNNEPQNPNLSDNSGSTAVGSNRKKQVHDLVDLIYIKLKGANWKVHPEVVNQLAHLTKEELSWALRHWNNLYKKNVSGETLYQFIYNEVGSTKHYAPALNYIKSFGWQLL